MGLIELPSHKTFQNLTGRTFGNLRVSHFAGMQQVGQWRKAAWACICECGGQKTALSNNLLNGVTTSCGCVHREGVSRRMRTHGLSNSPEFHVWAAMIDRCHNPRNRDFPNYGGRGIRVCDQWHTFGRFIEDIGRRPGAKFSIERLNNDIGYQPGNCRWATRREQCRNKRTSVMVEFQGKRQCVADWEKELGIPRGRAAARLRMGWSVERALTSKSPSMRRIGASSC